MQTRVKRVERLVKLLKEPEPRFVSIVDHGANQTPWKSLKRVRPAAAGKSTKQGASPMPKIKRRLTRLSTKKNADVNTGVLKLVFDSEHFATLKSVKSYLAENQWTGYDVADTDDGFEATSKGLTEADFDGKMRTIDAEDGVKAVVGTLKAVDAEDEEDEAEPRVTGKGKVIADKAADDEDDEDEAEDEEDESEEEDDEPAAKGAKKPVPAKQPSGYGKGGTKKSDEPSALKKAFDGWSAYMSSETTLAGVLEDGMSDGLPPGYDAIMLSASTAIGNILRDEAVTDKDAKLAAVGTDMAGAISAAYKVFTALIDAEDATEAQKAFAKKQSELLAEICKDDKPDGGDGNAEPAPKANAGAPDNAALAAAMVSVSDAVKGMNKTIGQLADKVEGIAKTAKEAADTASKASKAVTDLAGRAPTSKAADTDPDADSGKVTNKGEAIAKANTEFARKMRRNLWGL